MIIKETIAGKERLVVDFQEDIFISTFNQKLSLNVLLTLTDNTQEFMYNGKLDLEKDYAMDKMDFVSLDPKVVLRFKNPKSIRNMILLLEDAEKLLLDKLPKKKSRHG